MTHISPLAQHEANSSQTVQKTKEKIYEDHDSIVLIAIVKLLQHKKVFKYIQIVLVCFHSAGLIYSTQGKFRILYDLQHVDSAVVQFIDCLSNVMFVATNIIGLISFSNSASLYNPIFELAKKKSCDLKNTRRNFQRYMTGLHVLTSLSMFISIYIFMFKVGWAVYQYLVSRDLEYYLFNISIYAVLCFVHKIKEIFQDVNQLLLELDHDFLAFCKMLTGDETNLNNEQSSKHLKQLKSITEYHHNVCNLLDQFNSYFKTVLVFIVLCMIVNILWDCTIMIEFAVKPKNMDIINISLWAYIFYPMLIMITTGQAALGALVGENIVEEGQKTTVLCYSLLNKLPTHLESRNDQLIEKQINFLLDQSKTRNVSIHAGGFFKLDWGILGLIASTVTTYSIVIIQFLLK